MEPIYVGSAYVLVDRENIPHGINEDHQPVPASACGRLLLLGRDLSSAEQLARSQGWLDGDVYRVRRITLTVDGN